MTEPVTPADDLAERSVLGAIMSAPDAIHTAAEHLAPEDFYAPRHAEIFAAALRLADSGKPIDPLLLGDELGDRLEKLGGAVYLLTCYQDCPTAASIGYYAEIVAGHAVRRAIAQAGQRVVQIAGLDRDPADLAEQARQQLDAVSRRARGTLTIDEVGPLADHALTRYAAPEPPTLPTGWPSLDELLGGLRPGTLTVIGARPGVGKSVLGGNLVTNTARRGQGALFVSLEMPKAELVDRILANVASVELTAITKHRLAPDDWERLHRAADEMRAWPLRIVDQPDMGLLGIRTAARDLTRTERGLAVIVVDYLQLIRPADTKPPRHEQVATFSRGLKLLAKELAVPVVALAQVNRGAADRRPALSDLRESGAIEADADAVLLLHYDASDPNDYDALAHLEVNIAKNRHGRTGPAKLRWSPHYARAAD